METEILAPDLTGSESQSTAIPSTEMTPSAPPESQITQGAPEGEQGKPEQIDGRRGPQNIRASIKAVAEWAQAGGNGALPDHAEALKHLGAAYFREQTYKQHFATPQEAQAAKSLIEGVGGIEGIQAIQERTAAYDAQDEGLRTGNPEVLDALFKDFPEGAAALAPHYLDQLAKLNPEAYSAAVGPRAIAILDNAGFFGHVKAMQAETDPTRLKNMLDQLAGWAENQQKNAKVPQPAPTQNDAAKKEREEIQAEKDKIFSDRVEFFVSSAIERDLERVTNLYVKQNGLNDTQKAHYLKELKTALIESLNADQTYLKQVGIRRNSKTSTPKIVADYISGEFKSRLNDSSPETSIPYRVAQIFGAKAPAGTTTGVVRPETPKTSPGGGPIRVSVRPQDSDFAEYPDLDLDLINGRAKLKDGRYVTWR